MPDIPNHAIILAAEVGFCLRLLNETKSNPLNEVRRTPISHNALGKLAALGFAKRPSSAAIERTIS
ncbi:MULTISPECIES: hypothetical protein [unclassified Bradyrhizobium]